MAQIFFSYSKQDIHIIKPIVESLEDEGYTVWWDRVLAPGTEWPKALERELDICDCVVVTWSRSSVNSDWVKKEAEIGKDRGILCPALIENVTLPSAFADIQCEDLTRWTGRLSTMDWQRFVSVVKRIISDPDHAPKPLQGPLSARFPINDPSVALANILVLPFYSEKDGYKSWRPMDRITGAQYISTELGVSVALDHDTDGFEANIFVYSKGIARIPSGASSSLVHNELTLAKSAVERAHNLLSDWNDEHYVYQKEGMLKYWLFTEGELFMNNAVQFSVIYVTVWENQFIKVRHSFPVQTESSNDYKFAASLRIRSIIDGFNYASINLLR